MRMSGSTIELSGSYGAGYGPTIEEFQLRLFNAKKRIRGFEIVAG
jgi:hypothetical protein